MASRLKIDVSCDTTNKSSPKLKRNLLLLFVLLFCLRLLKKLRHVYLLTLFEHKWNASNFTSTSSPLPDPFLSHKSFTSCNFSCSKERMWNLYHIFSPEKKKEECLRKEFFSPHRSPFRSRIKYYINFFLSVKFMWWDRREENVLYLWWGMIFFFPPSRRRFFSGPHFCMFRESFFSGFRFPRGVFFLRAR